MRLRILCVSVLLALSACADPYPLAYPPQYASLEQVPPTLLPVPPAPYSPVWNADIAELIEKQRDITPERLAKMRAEQPIEPQMMTVPLLGKEVTEQTHPALFTLLLKSESDSQRIWDAAKAYYRTTRPWLLDSRVQLLIEKPNSFAYPSGHTTTAYLWAAILSDVMPCQRETLFARAAEIAAHRQYAGVHYGHDLRGGKALAALIYEAMKDSPAYQADMRAAKAEMRTRMH
jgi:acid phosphatase (class A)